MQTLLTRFRARDRAVSASTRSTVSSASSDTYSPHTPSAAHPPLTPNTPYSPDTPYSPTPGTTDTTSDYAPATPTPARAKPSLYARKIHPHVDALLEEYAAAPPSRTPSPPPQSAARLTPPLAAPALAAPSAASTPRRFSPPTTPGGLAPPPPAAHAQPAQREPSTPRRAPQTPRTPSSGSSTHGPSTNRFLGLGFGTAGGSRSRVSLPGAADVWSTFGRRRSEEQRPRASLDAPVGVTEEGVRGPSAWFTRRASRRTNAGSMSSLHEVRADKDAGKEGEDAKDGGRGSKTPSTRSSAGAGGGGKENRAPLPRAFASPPASAFREGASASAAGTPASGAASPPASAFREGALRAPTALSPASSFMAPGVAVQPPTRAGSPMRGVNGLTYPPERARTRSVDLPAEPLRGAYVGVETMEGREDGMGMGAGGRRSPLRTYRSTPRASAVFEEGERRPSAARWSAAALGGGAEGEEWPARVSGELVRLSLGNSQRQRVASYSRRSALSGSSVGSGGNQSEIAGRPSTDTFGPRGSGARSRRRVVSGGARKLSPPTTISAPPSSARSAHTPGPSPASDATSPPETSRHSLSSTMQAGPSTLAPPITPRQTKPLRSSLRTPRASLTPGGFPDEFGARPSSGLGIRSTATPTYPSDAARLLAERLARGESAPGEFWADLAGEGEGTPVGKGKRKADEADVTPPEARRTRFDAGAHNGTPLPPAFPPRHPKRARLSSPEPHPPRSNTPFSRISIARSRAASPDGRRSLSGASIPLSALVAPHAPGLGHVADGSYRMRDPKRPRSRAQMRTPWTLHAARDGEPGSPAHAWLFYLGFVTLLAWFVGAALRVPETRVLDVAEKGVGGQVLVDDPQVEFDARSWRKRCRVMCVVGACTYVPFIVLVAVFASR